MKTFDGYKKRALTDEYALLAGGGHKPLSEFSTSSHTHSVKINDTIKTISALGGAAVDLGSYLSSILVSAALDNITWALTASNTYKRAFIYNTNATEYSYLFGLKNDGKFGAILKMGYTDRYLRILRVNNGNWQSTDWEKISAGYADSAGAVAWANVTGKPGTFAPSAHNHPTSQINALTSYTKATAAAALTTTDSLNTALGKLEYKLDVAYNLVTKANDGDGTIENLKEILDVLAGIKDTETIKAIIGKYLPLSGGTMTGLIKGNNKGGAWIAGRSNATIYQPRNTENDWHPVIGFKTKTGSWEFGSVGDDLATFSWGSDSNYTAGTNDTITVSLRNKSGTIALTSEIPTALKNPYTLTFTAGTFAAKTYDGSSAVTVNIPTHTSHLINNSGFLTEHLSLANYVTLNTALTISGVKTFSTLLKFTVAQGTSPFIVTSTTKVDNLNADMLDGYHANSFFKILNGVDSNSNANNINQLGGFLNATGNGSGNSNYPETYSDFFNFPIYYHTQFSCRTNFYWRTLYSNPNGTNWRTLIDSYNYTSYVNPKATSKTIWGLTYIDASGNFLNVNGLLYVAANGNTTTIGSLNSSWCHIYNSADVPFIFNKSIHTIGNVLPHGNNIYQLGDSSNKWKHLYLSNRAYLDEWIQFNGSSGLYWPNANGAHLYANTTTSYGALITLGSRGGYCGLHCGPDNTYMTIMSHKDNLGLYNESRGRWSIYYNRPNDRISIYDSSVDLGYGVQINQRTGIKINSHPSLHLVRTDAGETSMYFSNNKAGWAIGVNTWDVGVGSFAIGLYSGTGGSYWRFRIDTNGFCHTSSYLSLGEGNEKNASNPPYVWGVNGSDNYLRTYATSSLRVGYATTADTIDSFHINSWGYPYKYYKIITCSIVRKTWYVKLTLGGYEQWKYFIIDCRYNNSHGPIIVRRTGFGNGLKIETLHTNGNHLIGICYDAVYHSTEHLNIIYLRFNAIEDRSNYHYSPSSSTDLELWSDSNFTMTLLGETEPSLSKGRSWVRISSDNETYEGSTIHHGNINPNITNTWNLGDSTYKWAGVYAIEFFGSINWANITNKPSTFTPSAHTHTWLSITNKVAGNEFNFLPSTFTFTSLWFNYLPENDRNTKLSLNEYHFGNGGLSYAYLKAAGYRKNGSNDNYLLLGGGGHKALSDFAASSHTHAYLPYKSTTTTDANSLTYGLTLIKNNPTNAAHTNHSAFLYLNDCGTPFLIQIPDSSVMYVYKRYYSGGSWSAWSKMYAGYADSAGSVAWGNVTGKPINLKAYSGSLSSAGWKTLQGNNSSPSIAISYNNSAANWNSGTYSASMVWGCSDTRGLIDCAYNTPKVTFGGCSFGGATDNNPTWYFKLAGTTGTEYNLDTRWSLVGHNHDGKYLRKDTNDSTSYQYEFTKTNDHAIKVGTIRGRAVGSQTGEFIHLYERVAIGSPNGWGSRPAPSYGLATYGGAWLATDTGNVGIGTTSPGYKLHVAGDIYTTTGFKKNGSSNSYVLLGGGGHKAESSLSVNYANSAGNSVTATKLNQGSGVNDDACMPSGAQQFQVFTTSGASGTRGGADGHIMAFTWSSTSSYGAQIYIDTDPSNTMCVRTRSSSGVWSNWQTVAFTDSNVASATNADMVDGYHASAFALSNHTHNYAGSSSAGGAAYSSNCLRYTGTGNGVITAYLTNVAYMGSDASWASYIICNHGDGSSYYNQTIRMPFWGVPQYQRLEGGTYSGWKTFITSENISSQSVNYANSSGYADSAGNAESVDGQHFNWSNNRDDHSYLWAASSNGQAYLVHRASMSVNYANYSGYAQKLLVHDVRSATRTPNYFDGKRVTAWFNNTGTPDGNWWSGIHVKGWDNGYASWELCSYSSTGTGNDYNLYFRNGNNTSWGNWKTILTSSNYTSYINATNFPGLNKSGTVTSITVTGSNGLSGSGTVTTSGTITLSNSGVRSTTINGNYLRVNTNGTNTDLTIPYATNADTVDGYHASSFALRGHTHSNYLPLAGGTMDNNARISHNGNLYIGRSDNGGWVLCLDMCSLSSTGDTYWSLRTSGTLKVKFVYLDIIYPKTSAVKILGLMAVGDNSFSAKTGYWLSSQSIYVGNENKTEFFDLSGDGIHVIHPLPHIDFYKGKSSVDGNYTLRLIENTEGRLTLDSATTTPSLLLAGNIYALGYYESSDITLKTNFSKISTTIEQISDLPVFDFSWKENLSSRNTGTSAQAVQTILPNIVTESNGSLKLDYGVLGTVAGIIACKELVIQKSEIGQLRERVIELEKQLNEYRGIRNSLGN